MRHENEYKLTAVKLYLKLKSLRNTCDMLNCSKSSLQRWLERYFENGNIYNVKYPKRKSIITDNMLEFIRKIIKDNPAINLALLKNKLINKFKIYISLSYLYYIIKYRLNITHKQLRIKYYPEKKVKTRTEDKRVFYNTILKKGIKNIISIDESAFYLNMTKNFGRCDKGKRCAKTVNVYPYVKFNFICAIKYMVKLLVINFMRNKRRNKCRKI